MNNRITLEDEIELSGIEPFGGNIVHVTLKPKEENTGITFETPEGNVDATLEKAANISFTVALNHSKIQVLISNSLALQTVKSCAR